jgi:hypothetical protein
VHEFSVDPSATILVVRTVRFAAFALSGGLALVSAAAAREALPWVDDYSRAVVQARAKNVPIFVEAWAPW